MSRQSLPLARSIHLIVETVGNETLVYDRKTDKAYVLSPSAAAVWRASNGMRSVADIATYLNQNIPMTETAVWYALGQLNDLLEAPVALPSEIATLSRRKFLKLSGAVTAGLTLPLVVTIVAPSVASAQSATGVCCECRNPVVDLRVPALTCDDCSTACDKVGLPFDKCLDAGACIV